MEFRDISHISEAMTDKRMEYPYCQRRNCSPLNVVFSDCVDIARRSSARGRQTTARWQKQVFIHTRLSRAYLMLSRLSCFRNNAACGSFLTVLLLLNTVLNLTFSLLPISRLINHLIICQRLRFDFRLLALIDIDIARVCPHFHAI